MIPEFTALDKPTAEERLAALQDIYDESVRRDELPRQSGEVNNHVHTVYSFSPYTPAQAAFMAWKTGLGAVGIMDHDSFAGAGEMIEACKILGIGSTCGCELRVSSRGSALDGYSFNNPGSTGFFYIAIHGMPFSRIAEIESFLTPIREARNIRNREQTRRLNEFIAPFDLQTIDFDRDVLGRSMAAEGGAVTERHIIAALARNIIEQCGAGEGTLAFLLNSLKLSLNSTLTGLLSDSANPHYLYDLLGVLKSNLQSRFFIQPDENECIPAGDAVEFARSVGAIPAYAYLGDVGDSPTGDKKAEKFEDSFIEQLMEELKKWGFLAVTFMPPRNTMEQLKRIMSLCRQHGFMQISGVDINSSRQSFSCPEVLLPEFAHLNSSTWALIAHEKLENFRPGTGLFGSGSLADTDLQLEKRIDIYSELGKLLDLHSVDVSPLLEAGGKEGM